MKVKIFLIIGRDDGQVFCALNVFAFHQNYKWTTNGLTIDISLLLALRIPTFFSRWWSAFFRMIDFTKDLSANDPE